MHVAILPFNFTLVGFASPWQPVGLGVGFGVGIGRGVGLGVGLGLGVGFGVGVPPPALQTNPADL